MAQSWHSLSGADTQSCVSVSNTESRPSQGEIYGALPLAPKEVSDHVYRVWREIRMTNAICELTELGWTLEECDNGLQCLVRRGWRANA